MARPIDANVAMKKICEHMENFPNANTRLAACRAILSMLGDKTQIPTLTPPNEWVCVEERKPEHGERVLATDGALVGEGYMDRYGVWCRPNGMRWDMLDSEVTHWMPLNAPPDCPPTGGRNMKCCKNCRFCSELVRP